MGRKFPGYEKGLKPEFRFLSDKAVIVQAWKKAHEYIRRHNWYSDTLELDMSCIQLECLFKEVAAIFPAKGELKYRPDPMRIVPAPKSSGGWHIKDGLLANDKSDSLGIRPLAHLSIRDQTVSMMFLMCLANIIENRQGRPVKYGEWDPNPAVSYGNRLLCSWDYEQEDEAHQGAGTFLWGNAETYDRYYNDYQAFISRPGDFLARTGGDVRTFYTVTLDLSKCYDRVRREVLLQKIRKECSSDKQDERFFGALEQSLRWRWSPEDEPLVRQYQEKLSESGRGDARWQSGLDGIPQGLVAGGFYANVYLLEFDDAIKKVIEERQWFSWGGCRVHVLDYCRYVDDMRLVIACEAGGTPDASECLSSDVCKWAQGLLDKHALGQLINEDKVKIVQFDGTNARSFAEEQIAEIKDCTSGPMDAKSAWELIRMNRALWPCGDHDGEDGPVNIDGLVVPGEMSKIKDETLERFVAYNWRRSYNRLSPELVLAYLLRHDVKVLSPYAAAISGLLRSESGGTDRRMWLDFLRADEKDPLIKDPDRRSLAEWHLSDLIQMLMQNFETRRTVMQKYKSVNLVVFPEIAVLPSDVPVLERFADHMNCIVFCGLIFPCHPFDRSNRVNAGLWIIPQRSMTKHQDRRMLVELLQGKENLTQPELDDNIKPFRPVQWLIRGMRDGRKIWSLSASICYDATDIKLLAAMRDKVDCFIVSSSNQDVNVYDSMTAAMRFHLYGHVVVANCGEFGGSTIQAPYRNDYERVIVHSHGKDQAVISLTTLRLRDFIRKRMRQRKGHSAYEPKTSPAGYKGRPN